MALILVLLSLFLSEPAQGQIIDRIMAVVANHVITLSDVSLERQIRETLGEKGATDDPTILNDLINAQVIDLDIIQSANIQVPEAAVDNVLRNIRDFHGLAESVVRDAVRRRLRVNQFFDIRFRQAIRATDDDVRQYYNNVFVPEERKRGVSTPTPLDQVSDTIQKNIVEEKTMHEVDVWLEAARQRSDIEIFP